MTQSLGSANVSLDQRYGCLATVDRLWVPFWRNKWHMEVRQRKHWWLRSQSQESRVCCTASCISRNIFHGRRRRFHSSLHHSGNHTWTRRFPCRRICRLGWYWSGTIEPVSHSELCWKFLASKALKSFPLILLVLLLASLDADQFWSLNKQLMPPWSIYRAW